MHPHENAIATGVHGKAFLKSSASYIHSILLGNIVSLIYFEKYYFYKIF